MNKKANGLQKQGSLRRMASGPIPASKWQVGGSELSQEEIFALRSFSHFEKLKHCFFEIVKEICFSKNKCSVVEHLLPATHDNALMYKKQMNIDVIIYF